MKQRLDFQNIAINPIDGFSKFIMENLNKAIDLFFQNKFKNIETDFKLIKKCDNDINDLKNEIELRYQNDNISWKKFFNALILIFCFLLIGLFFLPIFFANKNIINNFKEYKSDQQEKINELVSIKYNEIFSLFSSISLSDLYIFIFNYFGISSTNTFKKSYLLNLINDSNVIDIYSGIKGIIKNNPFYDVLYRQLNYRDIVTSKSQTFSYSVYENGKYVTRYERLTAYHHEKTPFIDNKNFVLFKTNFIKEIEITNNNKKKDKKILLENKDFIEITKISNDSKHSAQLSQFFTIKAQENFVDWYKINKLNVFNFKKFNDNFLIENSLEYNLDSLKYINSNFESLSFVEKTENLSIDNIIESTKNLLFKFFDRWTKMVQLPLLVPGIAREWYRKSGNYLIGENSDFEIEKIEKIRKIEPIESIYKFSDNRYFSFQEDYELKKGIWFKEENSYQDENRCIVSKMVINSFYSKILTDYVHVNGFHVGPKTIPVQYERFFPIQENKLLISFHKNYTTQQVFIIGKSVNDLIYKNNYTDNDFFKYVSKYSIWTNNPSEFEKSASNSILIKMAKEFMELNDIYPIDATLRIDQSGIYVFIDNFEMLNKELLKTISKIIYKFSTLNFL